MANSEKKSNPWVIALILGVLLIAIFAFLGQGESEPTGPVAPDGTPFKGPTSPPPESDIPPINFGQ